MQGHNFITVISALVLTLGSFLGNIWNCSPHTEDKERWKKEVGHSRLVGGKFNKQQNLCMRFVFRTQDQTHPVLTHQNLKFYSEAFTGLSQTFSPEHSYLSKQSLKMAPMLGMVGMVGSAYPKDRGWGRSLWLPRSSSHAGQLKVTSYQWPLATFRIPQMEPEKLNEPSITFFTLSLKWEGLIVAVWINAMHVVSIIQLLIF